MKLLLSAAAALLLVGSMAFAGDGYECSNSCPLAKTANTHRSNGSEAAATAKSSKVVREVAVARVRSNLDRI